MPAFGDTVPTKGCDAYDHRPADRPEAKRGRIVPRDTGRGAGRFPAVHLQVGIRYWLTEIDKLVALSRRFGVTVGWLLGVEEAPETASAPDSGELTDAQLKMVEEITERYLAAQTAPKPREKMALCAGSAGGIVCRLQYL